MTGRPITGHAGNVTAEAGSPGPDLSRFHTVDLTDDPGALIAFLEATDELPAFRALKSAMLDELRLPYARSVLDVGCGIGADLVEMLERMPAGSTATGLDISETMISEGRRRTASRGARISLGLGNAMALPYDDASFDCSRAETALQHVAEPPRAIAEMARVTRPGGRVAALEFDLGTAMVDHPDAPHAPAAAHTAARRAEGACARSVEPVVVATRTAGKQWRPSRRRRDSVPGSRHQGVSVLAYDKCLTIVDDFVGLVRG